MIRGIVEQSLEFRQLVAVFAVAMLFLGIVQLRSMPVDVLPEFAPPYVEIQTEALGLSTAEVESLVTVNLEMLLSGTPGLQTIRSRSVPGMSSILLIFERGTDIMLARLLVQERLTLARTLPHVSKPPAMLQPLSATSRVMMIGLSSNDLSLIEMSVLARWTIKPRLIGVPGVANVAIWGQRKRQMQVQVDPERLQANGVSLDQVIAATGNALWTSPLTYLYTAYPTTGGWIDTPQQRIGVRHVLPVSVADDLAQVTIEARDGAPLLLGDVAEVVEGHPPLIGDAVLKNGPGLLLVVEKFPGANTLEVTRGVEEVLDLLRRGLPGMEIDSQVFQATNFVELALGNLTRTLIVGAILVVLVLLAFHWDWRAALISLVAIPLSLVAALLVLNLTGATLNTMVLAGLVVAVGAVIDDAIMDIENIVRRLRQHRKEGGDKSIATIVLEASLEMRGAILFATFIMVVAVLPIFSMGGVSGAFVEPLALSYALALLASMVVALIVAPALGMVLLSNALLERRESPLVRWLQRGYEGILSRTVQKPLAAYVTVAVLVVAGLAVLPFLGQNLLPEFKERDLVIRWEGAPGTSHPEMVRITTQASRELQSIPGVRNVNAHVGRAVEGDEVVGINSSQLWVSLDPKADYETTRAAIQETVDDYPGLVRDAQTYLQEIIRQVLTGSDKAIVVRVYGPDFVVLRDQAERVGEVLSEIDGVVDLQVGSQVEEPHVEIEVDLAKAERYGLIPGDLRRAATTLVSGLEVGSLFEEKKVFDAVVWAIPQARNSLTDIRELLIDTPDGGQVRLGDVAELRVVSTPTLIRHEANLPYFDVGFNVRGRDLGSVMRDVERTLQEIEFPLEYHPEVIGEYAERQAARPQPGVAIAAAIGIFLLLQMAFDSWRLASLSFLTLPAALVGGVLAALLGGGSISLGSLVGFLAVLGIAARNGIMLMDHYRHLQQHEGETFGPGLVLRGARERLAPILMTALTTALALVPFVLFGDIAGHEIAHPMAIVILGGIVTATLLNLFVIPVLYLRFGGSSPVEASPEPSPAS